MATAIGSLFVKMGLNSKGFTSGVQKAQKRLKSFRGTSDKTGKSVRGLQRQVGKTKAIKKAAVAWKGLVGAMAGVVAIRSVVNVLRDIVQTGLRFKSVMAEVATLGVENMQALSKAVRETAMAYGLDLTDAAKGAYQVISAGASAMEAPEVLNVSAKAARAGVTSLNTAATLGMAAMNAYGDEVSELEGTLDSAFISVKNGVTTFEELSGALPQVLPLAQSLGVSFQEVSAAVTALTKAGFNASEAVTGLRGILAAVAKQTSQAQTQARSLGIEFSDTALRARGLGEFIRYIGDAADGSVPAIMKMMGRLEGTNAMLALGGEQSRFFNEQLAEQENRFGALDEAYSKFTDSNPAQAFDEMRAIIADVKVELSEHLIPMTIRFAKAQIYAAKAGSWMWRAYQNDISRVRLAMLKTLEFMDMDKYGGWWEAYMEAERQAIEEQRQGAGAHEKRQSRLDEMLNRLDRQLGVEAKITEEKEKQSKLDDTAAGRLAKFKWEKMERQIYPFKDIFGGKLSQTWGSLQANIEKIIYPFKDIFGGKLSQTWGAAKGETRISDEQMRLIQSLERQFKSPETKLRERLHELEEIRGLVSDKLYNKAVAAAYEQYNNSIASSMDTATDAAKRNMDATTRNADAWEQYGNTFEDVMRQIDRSRGISKDIEDVAFGGPMPVVRTSVTRTPVQRRPLMPQPVQPTGYLGTRTPGAGPAGSGGSQVVRDPESARLLSQILGYIRQHGMPAVVAG